MIIPLQQLLVTWWVHVVIIAPVYMSLSKLWVLVLGASQVALENPPANAGDSGEAGSIPGSGRSPAKAS